MQYEEPKITKDWSTHLPVLMKLMSLTSGNVLEIGTGIYSTPYLHWACLLQGRNLVSVENDEEYMEFAKQFASDTHKIQKEIPEGEWDIVFIDSFPLEERMTLIDYYSDKAKYIIVHDIDSEEYQGIFTHRFDYTEIYPHTSVFSDIINLDNFKI